MATDGRLAPIPWRAARAAVITVLVAGLSLQPTIAKSQANSPGQSPPPAMRLSLSQAVTLATGGNRATQIAALRVHEAQADVRKSRAALLPSVSAVAGFVNRSFNRRSLGIDFPTTPGQPPLPDLIGPFDNVDGRLRLTQTLLDVSSIRRVAASKALVRSDEANRDVAADNAAESAGLAYLRLARSAALVGARRADSTIAAELLSVAEAQRDAGVSTAIDVNRARTQLLTAASELVVSRNNQAQSQIDLARTLGVDPATPIEALDTLSSTLGGSEAPPAPAAAIQLATARRSELKAEAARADRADADRGAVLGERLPRLELAADYGLNGLRVGDAIATRQIAVQVTIPFFDGLSREARLSALTAVRQEADLRRRDLEDQITAGVQASVLELASGVEQQSIAAERLRLALEELSLARERFSGGIAGNIEVINAQSSLLRARDADIEGRYAAAVARVHLARAAGVPQTIH